MQNNYFIIVFRPFFLPNQSSLVLPSLFYYFSSKEGYPLPGGFLWNFMMEGQEEVII